MSKHQDAAHCHKDNFDNHPREPCCKGSITARIQIRTLRNGLCKTELRAVGSEVVGAFVVGSQEVGQADTPAIAGPMAGQAVPKDLRPSESAGIFKSDNVYYVK